MVKRITVFLLVSLLLFSLSSSVNATLIDMGDGLIYDDVLDITWLQDANYAKTSGYDSDGYITWHEAMAWADGLVYGGYDDWRLPDAHSIDGNGPYSGNNSEMGEMGHLYYIGLGNAPDTPFNSGPFINIQHNSYWTNTSYFNAGAGTDNYAWFFEFGNTTGHQNWNYKTAKGFSMIVRDGGAPVPEPATFLLFGLGLLGLAGVSRKKHGN